MVTVRNAVVGLGFWASVVGLIFNLVTVGPALLSVAAMVSMIVFAHLSD